MLVAATALFVIKDENRTTNVEVAAVPMLILVVFRRVGPLLFTCCCCCFCNVEPAYLAVERACPSIAETALVGLAYFSIAETAPLSRLIPY